MPEPLPKPLYLYYKSCIKQMIKHFGWPNARPHRWCARARIWLYAFCMSARRFNPSRSCRHWGTDCAGAHMGVRPRVWAVFFGV